MTSISASAKARRDTSTIVDEDRAQTRVEHRGLRAREQARMRRGVRTDRHRFESLLFEDGRDARFEIGAAPSVEQRHRRVSKSLRDGGARPRAGRTRRSARFPCRRRRGARGFRLPHRREAAILRTTRANRSGRRLVADREQVSEAFGHAPHRGRSLAFEQCVGARAWWRAAARWEAHARPRACR
jgi:hypothetical protein